MISGTTPRDAGWWNNWFDHYRAFVIQYADMANLSGSQALIIGGDWIAPALPSGTLANGNPSGVPADTETRWLNLIAEIRQHFHGNVIFALPYDNSIIIAPITILQNTDAVYWLWFVKLSDQAAPNKTDMLAEAGRLLDTNMQPTQAQVNKPFLIGLSYPSSTSSATGCIPGGSELPVLDRAEPPEPRCEHSQSGFAAASGSL